MEMNKNCIILEIIGTAVWTITGDYDAPAQRFTEEEAAAEIDRLIRGSPYARYQVVTLVP